MLQARPYGRIKNGGTLMSKHISRITMDEGIEEIKELMALIESQPDIQLSATYISSVLARIKNVTIPATYSAGMRGEK